MTEPTKINFLDLIAPSFYGVHRDIGENAHTHYALCGGRGSCKSSFVSLEIVRGIMADKEANAVVIRKIGKNLRESVYAPMKIIAFSIFFASMKSGRGTTKKSMSKLANL